MCLQVRDGMVNVQQGIMLLCHTVAEVTNRVGLHNTRSTQALKGFLSVSGQNGGAVSALQGNQQYSLPSIPSGGAAGLNLLLDNAAVESSPGGDYDMSVQASGEASSRRRVQSEPVGINSSGRPEEAVTRGTSGPPSFPKGAIAAVQPSSMFWGMGRK